MKIKQIMYRSYSDLVPQEKRFYTLNSEKYELNTCEKCKMIDSTYELAWNTYADLKGWTCLCEDCFFNVGGEYYV
jgi:hypothetical protein